MDWQLWINYVSGKPLLLWGTHSDTSGPPILLQETQYGLGDVKHVCEFLSKTQVAGKSRRNSIKHWNFVFRETKVSNKPNPKESEFRMHLPPYIDRSSQKLFYLSVKTTLGLRSTYKFREQRPVLCTSKGCQPKYLVHPRFPVGL